jgi:hypothetical protein
VARRNRRLSRPVQPIESPAPESSRQQHARSFGLRAALSLAKLYRATGRDAEAHALLGTALEGFAPTPEFPEINEALEMIAAIEAAPQA